ncbi:MAG: hypothetical protein LLG04_02155 [Parachlamydia sp.]|nr:hypothetical protein [Parachlamydia sp.]
MVSPELRATLNPESLHRWESTGIVSAPYAGIGMERETQSMNEHLNRFVSLFKSASWMRDTNTCKELNSDITELTRLLKSRKDGIQQMSNIPFLKGDIFFCQESKKRASEVKAIVDHFASRPHAGKELGTLSGNLAKLIRKFDKELEQDHALLKTSLTEKLQDAITYAYRHSTKSSPHYLEESLGMTLGQYSGDNRALAKAMKPAHQKLRDNAFFHQTLAALQLMEKGFIQKGDKVPPILAGKLEVIKGELAEMFPKQTHTYLLRKTIGEAYSHGSLLVSRLVEKSLGRHFGANSSENMELREILHHPDLDNVSNEKLNEMTRRAVELIRKGFRQMDEPIPKQLALQLDDLAGLSQ